MKTMYYKRNKVAELLRKLVAQSDGHLRLADVMCETAVRIDQRPHRGGPVEQYELAEGLLDRVALMLDSVSHE